ncbi:MAG: septum formation initiator family protein [Treponema sp.]|jgi:hypothetical protein|nr:septum formation initiator family protein [Treponema sp.]
MKFLKYFHVLWIGFFLYAAFSVSSGASGMSAYSQLETEMNKEMANIEFLKQINQNLENAKKSILSDMDTISVHAKEQGFASRGERFARIVGMGIPQRQAGSPGQVVSPVSPIYTPDRFIKIFSLCAALTVLVCMVTYDFLQFLKDR